MQILNSNNSSLLLINYKIGKYVISQNPQQGGSKRSSSSHRLDILKSFYYHAVIKFLIPHNETNNDKDSLGDDNIGKETFWCSEYHKCHAAKEKDNIICILYKSTIPTHTMRFLTFSTMRLLTMDKQTCW